MTPEECLCWRRKPCKHERKWQAEQFQRDQDQRLKQALTANDVDWLRANGYDPYERRNPYRSGLRG